MAIYDDGHAYCFSCRTYFPPADRAIGNFTYEYLPWRGVTKDVMRFYGVQTKIDESGKPQELQFVYPNGNPKLRHLEHKNFYLLKGKPLVGLFGSDKFAAGSADTITITEGELDALSLYQALHYRTGTSKFPVVSVQSAATAFRDCSLARDWINSFARIYLAFDSDAAGREATAAVQRLFAPNKVFVVKFSNRKDANEYVQNGEEEQLRNIWLNSKRYLPDAILASYSDFENILKKPKKSSVPYPFVTLTDMTYGIRTGETVLFTALEKVGKTEVMHFIEHQLLKETDANVGAIFTEEPPLRHLQALAGIENGRPYHLPDHAGEPDEILSTIQKTTRRDDRLFIYSHFGSDDPDVLIDTIRYLVTACNCKYILFDHLSMVVSGLRDEADERRTLDYIVTRLEMLVKELDFALIMVSHVNDQGQTRGSRMPTKVADITIGVFRDLQHPDPLERSKWHFRVLYNRFSSSTGYAGCYSFDLSTYSFKQEAANDNTYATPSDDEGRSRGTVQRGVSEFQGLREVA